MTPRSAEFIAIGSELLEPVRHDTNGSYVALRLGEIGVPLRFRTLVGDRLDDLCAAFRVALDRSDLVIATGGLGPTVDDLTREALAEVLGLPLLEDAEVLRGLLERFRRLGRDMPPRNRLQALVPRGAEIVPNRNGSAPGLLLKHRESLIALLPGVPHEMRPMLEDSVLPRVGATGRRFARRVFKIAGLGESEVDRRLAAVHAGAQGVDWTILAAPAQIEIHLRETVLDQGRALEIDRLDKEISEVLGVHLFARDGATMEEVVGRLLLDAGATVATAESVTGGGIGRAITRVPGSSGYFRGGVVCYSDAAKVRIVGVRPETLAAYGAVSPQVANEMADGVRRLLDSSWGIAATGYAGPEAGGDTAPPGTVHLALSGAMPLQSELLRLPGDRDMVRERTVQAALDLLRRALLGAGA